MRRCLPFLTSQPGATYCSKAIVLHACVPSRVRYGKHDSAEGYAPPSAQDELGTALGCLWERGARN